MMSCFTAYSSGNTTRNVIFKITVKSLMFTIFNFKISKITTWMLGGKWPFLDIILSSSCSLLLLFVWISVVATSVSAVLVIKAAIGCVVRNFTHAFRIYRHGLVSFLRHSENLAHRAWSWGGAVQATGYVALLDDAILVTELLEIWVL